MAITCPNCGHQYDATLFVFGQSIQCECGTSFDISQGNDHWQTIINFLSKQALDDIGILASRALMIGDDLENDIGGAQSHGIRGILVRTGKYRPSDETQATIKPHLVVNTFADAIEHILQLVTNT
jgi:phosphoglycolate phosphatase-like HAD superfamily hydrolase